MVSQILQDLQQMGSELNRQGMARFGINTEKAFGISVTELRKYGKVYQKNHQLALELWKSGFHEARILAAIIDDPAQVTPEQMETWVKDFNSWDLCDQACTGLFDKTPFAKKQAKAWSTRKEEFEKRAGFALMAGLAWHSKTEPNKTFLDFLPLIKQQATDERNFVKKAVNWALRQIGKRNPSLLKAACQTAKEIEKMDSKSARWIAADALREFQVKSAELVSKA